MGLAPKRPQADARWFGIGVHIAQAKWYRPGLRRGPHPAKTFANWVGDEIAYVRTYLGDRYEESRWEEARELGIAMLEGYVEYWGRDDHWEVIATEQPFKTRIIREGKPVAIFASRWDGVIRDRRTGMILLLEHKTASQIHTAYLELDDQAGAYCAVANQVLRAKGVLKPGESIGGIQYNFLRKVMPDDRPRNEQGLYLNKDGSVSKQQPSPRYVRPDPIERSAKMDVTQLQRLSDEVAVMNAMRDGVIPVTKSTTRDCTWCDFFMMCQLHERGGNAWKEVMKSDFIQADPYEDIRAGLIIKSASGS